MPLKFNEQLGQFEQVQEYAPDPAQLTHLQAELKRLEARAEEIQTQITATTQEELATQAQLGTLRADNSLEGIDRRVSAILAAEKKLELLESRYRALQGLLSTTRTQLQKLPAQISGYQDAIARENNSQAIEEFLPTFLSHQQQYLESRERLRELLLQKNNFSTWRLEWFSKLELAENRVFRFITIK